MPNLSNSNLRPGMIQLSAPVPLSWRDRRDKALLPVRKYEKEVKHSDSERLVRNATRAAATGALAGALLRGRGGALRGAAAGVGAVAAIHATARKDFYGDRSEGSKAAEKLPALAGGVVAAIAAKRKLKGALVKIPKHFAAKVRATEFMVDPETGEFVPSRGGVPHGLDKLAAKLARQGKKLAVAKPSLTQLQAGKTDRVKRLLQLSRRVKPVQFASEAEALRKKEANDTSAGVLGGMATGAGAAHLVGGRLGKQAGLRAIGDYNAVYGATVRRAGLSVPKAPPVHVNSRAGKAILNSAVEASRSRLTVPGLVGGAIVGAGVARAVSKGLRERRKAKLVEAAARLKAIQFDLAGEGVKVGGTALAGIARKLGKRFADAPLLAKSAAVGGLAFAPVGAAAAAIAPDKGSTRTESATHAAVRDGLFGAGLYGIGEPLVKKVLRVPHLASRKLNGSKLVELAAFRLRREKHQKYAAKL